MQIERFYLGCLAHASYLAYDAGEAAVIDPQRDVAIYIERAAELGLKIRWIIETHLHADFVSGHLELAQLTGATICIGAGSGATYAHRELRDGDEIPLGEDSLRAIATPGHTEESVCVLALEAGVPKAVFTGDTLFIGDVGRPDLSPARTPEQLAAMLYDSLHTKLLTLPGETIVYPAHGAGSLCGRSMSDDASSTIAREQRTNYALQPMSRDEFVHLLTGDLPPRPAYFQDEVERNRTGAVPLEDLPPVTELSPEQVSQLQASGAVVLDTRPWAQFAAAHIPGSINIALAGQFASWAARILGIDGAPVVLVAEDSIAVAEARMRLARVGLESVAGALAGGIMGWIDAGRPAVSVDQIAASELQEWLDSGSGHKTLLDIREPSERAAGFIPGSVSIPLPELQERLSDLDHAAPIAVHCRGGYRSAIAASLLQAAGFRDVVNVAGGYDAWALSAAAATAGA
jgi:glyoxylase-like metal-dependent hydrolase (beta-lactamase superfamily II)/rhodanese-related sulfurtransferase